MSVTTKEIIDYVMESPHNTNPAVLRSLLNQYNSSSDISITPVLTLIVINNSSTSLTATPIQILNGTLVQIATGMEIAPKSTRIIETIIQGLSYQSEEPVYDTLLTRILRPAGETSINLFYGLNVSFTNAVNCSAGRGPYDDNYQIVITDVTQNASLTVMLQDSLA